jgi:hypothetical protein
MRDLIQIDAVFFWDIGYEVDPGEQRNKKSIISFPTQSLGRTLVASIGPVCSVALRKLTVRVDIEAQPPKLGPFIEAINAALSDRCPLGKS